MIERHPAGVAQPDSTLTKAIEFCRENGDLEKAFEGAKKYADNDLPHRQGILLGIMHKAQEQSNLKIIFEAMAETTPNLPVHLELLKEDIALQVQNLPEQLKDKALEFARSTSYETCKTAVLEGLKSAYEEEGKTEKVEEINKLLHP